MVSENFTAERPVKQIGENPRTFSARLRRWINAHNDALNLQVGDPIRYGSAKTRYASHFRRPCDPVFMERLTGHELAEFLAEEEERRVRKNNREAFRARPEVQNAYCVQEAIENHLPHIIDRLTPEEWVTLANKLRD